LTAASKFSEMATSKLVQKACTLRAGLHWVNWVLWATFLTGTCWNYKLSAAERAELTARSLLAEASIAGGVVVCVTLPSALARQRVARACHLAFIGGTTV
jgi:hypothetical protein